MTRSDVNTPWRLLLVSLMALHVACGGCGEDETPTGMQQGDDEDMAASEDMAPEVDMAPEEDMAPEVDMAPPVWPAYAVVEVDPVEALYAVDDEVTPTVTVFGTDEQELADAEVTWTVTPQDAALRSEGEAWVLKQEGQITFEACTVALDYGGAPVCASLDLFVDGGGPALTLTEPQPGAEIDGSQALTIPVSGVVEDTHGEVRVFVNGQEAAVDEQGNFSLMLAPHFGVNHIEVVATDGLNEEETRRDLDVLWAPAWDPGPMAPDVAGAEFDDGLILRLGQTFFDDGRPPVTTMEGASFTEDMADILTLLLRYIDLTAIIPNPVVDSSDLSLSITRADLGRPELTLDVTEEGLELYLRTDSMVIDTMGQLNLLDETLGLTGTITVGVAILAKIKIDKPGVDDPFDVQITELDVAIEQATSSFNDPNADAIFELAQSALRLQIETVLVDALKASFLDTIPQLLGDALNSVDTALAGQTFPLDPGLGSGSFDVTFSGKIIDFAKAPLQHATATVRAGLTTAITPTKTSLGTAMMTPYKQGAAPFFENSRVQIALRLALINGLLHGLWDGGLLDLEATELLPEDLKGLIEQATIAAKLPPIASPPLEGEPFDLMLHIGQLELTIKNPIGDQVVTYGVNLSAGVNVGVANNELAIEISDTPDVLIWVIEVEGGGRARLKPSQLEGLFYSKLWPELTTALDQGLGLPLPVLEIPELGMYAPALSMFSLTFDQVRPVFVQDGFVIVDSRLRGTLPASN